MLSLVTLINRTEAAGFRFFPLFDEELNFTFAQVGGSCRATVWVLFWGLMWVDVLQTSLGITM